MKAELSSKLSYKSSVSALAVLSVICGISTSFLGVIAMPLGAAILAVLMIYSKRIYIPALASSAILALNTVIGVLQGEYIPLLSIETILFAVIIAFAYRKGTTKGETAFWLTALASFMIVFTLILEAVYATGEVSLSAIKDYYLEIYSAFKNEFINVLTGMTTSLGNGSSEVMINPDDAELIFNSLVNSLISLVIILGFLITGVTFKVFSAIVGHLDKEPTTIYNWRFYTPNSFVYFFIGVLALSLFVGTGTDAFSVTVANINTVLTAVYAYIGFNYVSVMLSGFKRPRLMRIFLIIALFFATSIAFSILSVFGIVFTLINNKINSNS